MPTVLRIDGFRFFFYSNEGSEPPHIHVERGDEAAKFWLDPVELADSVGFSAKEINLLRRLVIEHQATLLQAWHDYFN
jgi:hypothetical protein